jgi:hypothetical protein
MGASVSWTRPIEPKPRPPRTQPTTRPVATTKPTKAQRRKVLREIKRGLRLLQKKKYLAFLKRFISPQDKQRILRHNKLKVLAPRFGKHKARTLEVVFEWLLKHKPKSHFQNKRLVFSLKRCPHTTPRDHIHFVNIKGTWYIKD